MPTKTNAAHVLGARGEVAAVRHLTRLGWTILDRNWRCSEGELDIIAHDGRRYVVCEVKTRSGARFGHPLEAITAGKAERLRRLTQRWAAEHQVPITQVRIDVLGLLRADDDGFLIDHVQEIC